MNNIEKIQKHLMNIEKRAEKVDDAKLKETFVNAAPLLDVVSTSDNQIIFGRRGTGKTHLLKYISDLMRENGDLDVYIDLRTVGSNGSIYNDENLSTSERATPLLLDVLQNIHDSLLDIIVSDEVYDLGKLGPLLDAFADACSAVKVVGTVETYEEKMNDTKQEDNLSLEANTDFKSPSLKGGFSSTETINESERKTEKKTGSQRYYVNFGDVQRTLKNIINTIHGKKIYVFLDEWSEVPIILQPYLADLIRRCIIPLKNITVKIAAIEHRSNLSISKGNGEYIGLELGADIGGDVSLDDFMVFDNDSKRSVQFFSDLLFKHYKASIEENETISNSVDFIQALFTQNSAFEEFVRSCEGVPRDAVYMISMAARKAYNRTINIQDIRIVARDWYSRDKSQILRTMPALNDLLTWIIEEVIGKRRSRAFLLKTNERHKLIDSLFDARLIHILKKNISSNDTPGVRYDVYKLDYGCYVDLISSSRSPRGLLLQGDAPENIEDDGEFESFNYLDVPPDDYRSIRRAILDLSKFDSHAEQA